MKNIVFKEQEGVFVADFASEGNCVIQIDNGNVEPLKIYRHLQTSCSSLPVGPLCLLFESGLMFLWDHWSNLPFRWIQAG